MVKNLNVIKIDSLDMLISEMEKKQDTFYFRGMASKDWKIKSSVDRMLERIKSSNSNALLSEQRQNVFLEFKAQSLFVKNNEAELKKVLNVAPSDNFLIDENNFIQMQVILQHYGYPTRLTDWTKNWIKALFFCLEDTSQSSDFSLWCIERDCIPTINDAINNEKYLYPSALDDKNNLIKFYQRLREGVYLIDIPIFNRIKVQEGILLVSGHADYMIFEDHIINSEWLNDTNVIKYEISAKLRTQVQQLLIKEGITHNLLYPVDFLDQKITLDNQKIEQFMNKLYIKDFDI